MVRVSEELTSKVPFFPAWTVTENPSLSARVSTKSATISNVSLRVCP